MGQQKMKKISVPYLLLQIFGPLAVMIAAGAVSFSLLSENVGSIVFMVAFLAAVLWWSLAPTQIYKKKKEKKMKELDNAGFVRNHTFNADGCTVAVDIVHGKIAMVFKWNPGQCYVLSAGGISKAWVDDGKRLGGTGRVSFLFIIDGVKVRVNTFTSNRVWGMNSSYVVEALSKADTMIEQLKAAYGTAQGN